MPAKLSIVGGFVTMTALATGYGMNDLWIGVTFILVLELLALIGQWRDWHWSASVVLICHICAAANGFWLQLPAGLMLVGAVAALTTWDLAHFGFRLSKAGRVDGLHDLERQHFLRLLTANSVGLLIAVVALRVQVKLSFGTALFVGLLAILGLSQAMRALRRGSD